VHTPCTPKQARKKFCFKFSKKKSPKDCLLVPVWKMQVHCQACSPAGSLIGRDHFSHRIPATYAMLEGKSQHSCHVCREKQAPDRENCEAVHYNALSKMPCRTLYRALFSSISHKTELLRVKVTIDFQRQCCKKSYLCAVCKL